MTAAQRPILLQPIIYWEETYADSLFHYSYPIEMQAAFEERYGESLFSFLKTIVNNRTSTIIFIDPLRTKPRCILPMTASWIFTMNFNITKIITE